MNLTTPLESLALLLAVLVIGHDLYARRVPNRVLVGVLGVAVAWQGAGLLGLVGIASPTLAHAALALGVALAVTLPFYACHWMGAGDVKLLAVLGFLLGLKPLLIVWVLGNVLVAVQALAIVALRVLGKLQPQVALLQTGFEQSRFNTRLQRPRQGRKGMPFAAYVGVGVVIYVFLGPWLEALW